MRRKGYSVPVYELREPRLGGGDRGRKSEGEKGFSLRDHQDCRGDGGAKGKKVQWKVGLRAVMATSKKTKGRRLRAFEDLRGEPDIVFLLLAQGRQKRGIANRNVGKFIMGNREKTTGKIKACDGGEVRSILNRKVLWEGVEGEVCKERGCKGRGMLRKLVLKS